VELLKVPLPEEITVDLLEVQLFLPPEGITVHLLKVELLKQKIAAPFATP